eukprot:m.100008 g.100008  ORF g.100008 m.100008 type:complete len:134 (+) comp15370_c1_seq1:119-520(+)
MSSQWPAGQVVAADVGSMPLFNMAQIQELREVVPDMYEVAEEAVQESVTSMQALRTKPPTPDSMAEFSEAGHKLKSGVGMLGCSRLELVAHKIEIMSKPGTPFFNPQVVFGIFDTALRPVVQETLGGLKQLFP